MRDRPPTTLRVPVSYALVSACAPSESHASAADGGSNHEWFTRAVNVCLNGTAAMYQRKTSQVCWVVMLPYAIHSLRERLSTTGLTSSYESALSILLVHTAVTFECLILEAEHASLEKEQANGHGREDGVRSPGHNLLQMLLSESNGPCTPVDTYGAPDEQVTSQLHVHCGLEGLCPLSVAVRCVVQEMLRREMCTLPTQIWRAACLYVMRWLEKGLAAVGSRVAEAEASLKQQIATGGLTLASMPDSQLVLTKLLLHEVGQAVKQGLQQVRLF